MKTRHLYRLFATFNNLLFNNELSIAKINIPRGGRDYYGMCYGQGMNGKLTGSRIAICIEDIKKDMPLGAYSVEKILLHEMVHLYQYILLGAKFGIADKLTLDWHDIETFNDFGQLAVDYGLINDKNLLTIEY